MVDERWLMNIECCSPAEQEKLQFYHREDKKVHGKRRKGFTTIRNKSLDVEYFHLNYIIQH